MGKQRERCLLDIGNFPQLTSSDFSLCFNECSGVDGAESAGALLGLLGIAIFNLKILHLHRPFHVHNPVRFQNKSMYFSWSFCQQSHHTSNSKFSVAGNHNVGKDSVHVTQKPGFPF